MRRQQALKVVLVLVGLLFTAALYPMTVILWHRDQNSGGDAMMLSLYFALGIFLLIAARNPPEHRSLIAFAAWSSFAHGVVMTVMAFQNPGDRGLLFGVTVLVVIGVALIGLAPAKPPLESVSTLAA